MKILAVVSTLDLKYKLGCTPAWWQLLKAFYELGNELIVIPYLGDAIESPWWRVYENPCAFESKLYNKLAEKIGLKAKSKGVKTTKMVLNLIKYKIRPKWKKHLTDILNREKNIDAILFINIPVNHFTTIPSFLKHTYGIPIIYYDGDMPTILPEYAVKRQFRFNYYEDADLAEYDFFITNSKGVVEKLKSLGAHRIATIYYGVDPDLYKPLNIKRDIDIFYYGHGSEAREKRLKFMIKEPSEALKDVKFVVGGLNFKIPLGNVHKYGHIPFSVWRTICCRSRINLNITRETHANVYASSTSRPFELAALQCCIVSDPYNGIEEWFEVGKEIYVAHSADDAINLYKWLLADDELQLKTGAYARAKILKMHTFRHRAAEFVNYMKRCI
jgi:spore maturation protein CgeB